MELYVLVYGKYECFVIQMLYVCVLCASCGSSQCCILHDLVEDVRSRFLLYSPGSGVNRVQVVLSGFSVRLFCPDKNFM